MKQKQIGAIQQYVKQLFATDATGHDYEHMRRVALVAKQIAMEEHADPFICEVGGWLHDIGDPKLFDDSITPVKNMNRFLQSIQLTSDEIQNINEAIKDVSFSRGGIPKTLEGKIVQDADRLDAIGAIGIARTFAYGGANNQLIYSEEHRENTSIQHFYDKLLTLKDLMNTHYAKTLAAERHQFMKRFLNQFYKEW